MIIKEFDLEDVLLLSEILDKMGLSIKTEKLSGMIKTDKLENVTDAASLGKDVIVSVGAELMVDFIKNIYKAKNLVYKFIANLTEQDEKAVKKMSVKDLKQFFSELLDQEGFKDFFKSAEDLTA